jgi:hypothetical protein
MLMTRQTPYQRRLEHLVRCGNGVIGTPTHYTEEIVPLGSLLFEYLLFPLCDLCLRQRSERGHSRLYLLHNRRALS